MPKSKQTASSSTRVETSRAPSAPINPEQVRYIKLGKGGGWEKQCLDTGTIRIAFGAGRQERFPLCGGGRWNDLREAFMADGIDKGLATRFTKELRLFFEDDGSTLWLTFIGGRMYWGFVDPSPALQDADQDSVYRRIRNGWRATNLAGERLTEDRLSGALTKLAAYRGTSCAITSDVRDYVVRRINGRQMPDLKSVLDDLKKLRLSLSKLMQRLGDQDFETLVGLVFSTSGWRRLARVGGPQKTIDIDLMLPSTDEKAFVQIKTHASSADLAEYIARFEQMEQYSRMFFVYHSGQVDILDDLDDRITVIDRTRLADMVIKAGLANWVTEKVL